MSALFRLPDLPRAPGKQIVLGQLYGDAYSLAIADIAKQAQRLCVVIADDVQHAHKLELSLRFFLQDSDIPLLHFPDWETLPYDHFSPHQDIVSERLRSLYQLPQMQHGILVVSAASLMQRLAPASFIQGHVFSLQQNQHIKPEILRAQLIAAGYQAVSQVLEHGEFSVRGSLIDLFPMGSHTPFRIDFLDDDIDSIRTFDPNTQRSETTCDSIQLLPAHEFPLNDSGISEFRQTYRNRFEGNPQANPIYRDISDGHAAAGSEYYLPLFFKSLATLFDYFPANTLLITESQIEHNAAQFWQEIAERYDQYGHDIERPLLKPDELYIDPSSIEAHLQNYPRIHIQTFEPIDRGATSFALQSQHPPAVLFDRRAERPSEKLQTFLQQFKGRCLFVCESAGRRESLLEWLHSLQLFPKRADNWQDFLHSDARIAITLGPLEEGLLLNDCAIITEPQLYGERAQQRRRRLARQRRDADAIITNLTDLSIGAPVVHEEHGVGRYLGLQSFPIAGITTEFLTLEYADGDRIYVPVASLYLISRYTGASPENAPLHRLGSDQWQKIKRKAAKRIRDIAAELLDLHARRAARQGFAFQPREDEMSAFAAQFPFEETPDQQTAIDAVIGDMISGKPMDRVICGDVGFGKTEVAMRATFTALQDQKQVAILVPTTLLAQQHFQNFRDRFADWPVRIECLSRFGTAKEEAEVLKSLAAGTVDVVIGTHKLIQNGIAFKDLGLVIIDEEHRFGVQHKERLKALRAEVDVLTLTATPIPRTLNMAMAGLRDLSIIATPPQKRLAIKTFVSEWQDSLISEACQRELKRGGQIYFVHNEVKSIEREAVKLNELLPEARIGIAHGQMSERELEKVMLDFYHQRCNLLLCTTIIESGIDVPSANTIIINRADKFGLAQLHQMRGRVGRSHHRAYAYLLTPPANVMTADAKKRLEAIESLEDLGAGFTLAAHDLEIRGAGELLGQEQSGQIEEIGYTLYIDMLERAVASLKSGKEPNLEGPARIHSEIDLGVTALIPDTYVPDVHLRLVIYKRIASADSNEMLRELKIEMIDRFGLLPEATQNLFAITELRLKLSVIGVREIKANAEAGYILFDEKPNIHPDRLIKLIQLQSKIFKFNGKTKLNFQKTTNDIHSRIEFIETTLLPLHNQEAA
ncbi:MAG: transcription-repair coupling factor [Gammaproteobacteria bacterium]|nr:transcription-repair coupling factor [Gammaproteobacteria bacterium]